MEHSNFIGIGANPNGPDLPLGFGMELAQNPKAMETFAAMTNVDKASLISRIQGAATGEDAKNRVSEAIHQLNGGQTHF